MDFWRYAARLKTEERKGWTKLSLSRVESVADHSYGVAMLALFEGERRHCSMETILKLALIHDLEESITGDLTPAKKKLLGQDEVHRQKEAAVKMLLQSLPVKWRKLFSELWGDLGHSRSREAKLIHQLDKFEMALQACENARRTGPKRVQGFYRSALRGMTDHALKQELRSVIDQSDRRR